MCCIDALDGCRIHSQFDAEFPPLTTVPISTLVEPVIVCTVASHIFKIGVIVKVNGPDNAGYTPILSLFPELPGNNAEYVFS
jgi:hypothetical protein